MSLRHSGTEYDYDMEFVVDLSKFKHVDPIVDADELFEYPATVEYTRVPYCCKGSTVTGTAQDIFDSIDEALLEWKTLLMYNDCKDRKMKITIHVEEVK